MFGVYNNNDERFVLTLVMVKTHCELKLVGYCICDICSNWNNLEDLHRWLLVREVDYEFRGAGIYKGAVYSGKWNTGMPHIQ